MPMGQLGQHQMNSGGFNNNGVPQFQSAIGGLYHGAMQGMSPSQGNMQVSPPGNDSGSVTDTMRASMSPRTHSEPKNRRGSLWVRRRDLQSGFNWPKGWALLLRGQGWVTFLRIELPGGGVESSGKVIASSPMTTNEDSGSDKTA